MPRIPVRRAGLRAALQLFESEFMRLPVSAAALLLLGASVSWSVAAQVAEAPSTVSATYHAPSATQALKPGDKIGNLFHLNMESPYVLQRLTPRTYWYQSGFYATVFYVGDQGVMLFDALEGRTKTVLEAIRSVTDKPVTTIVYSHDHADHIGDMPQLLAALKDQKVKPRIVASRATAEKMKTLKSALPRPTQVVGWPSSSFTFEKLKVELHGFTHAAHTDDHAAWLMVGERVLHAPDLLNPDQLPFLNFGGSERFLHLKQNLEAVDALPWDHFSGGHGNVGAHADFAFNLKFMDDLQAAVGKALGDVPGGFGVDMKAINAHTAIMAAWLDEVARRTTETLRPTYGKYYGFESSTPLNARMVAMYMFSYK